MASLGFEPDLFLSEFVMECREATDLAVQDVLTLEERYDQDSVDRIFRCLHSIKGNSSMLGLMDLSGFVHKVEDACSDIRSGERVADKQAINVLLKSFDLIDAAFENIVQEGSDKIDYSKGYSLLESLHGEAVPEEVPPVSAAAPAQQPEEVPEPAVETAAQAIPEPAQEVSPAPKQPDVCEVVDDLILEPESAINVRENPTALIVDDDFSSRKILSSFVSKFMPCYVAKDGVEAIQAVTESLSGSAPYFDLIVLDIMMPNIDGLQACKAIRQLERGRNMDTFGNEAKIIIASSLSDDKTIHKAVYECQADSYLVKPLSFKDVERLLVRFKLIAPE